MGQQRAPAQWQGIQHLSPVHDGSLPGGARHRRKGGRVGPHLLPSHARDFKNPKIDKCLARYVRGSNDIDYKERIKIMKLLWDAIGTEFGARHELYEMDYSGSHELVRLFPLQQAQASGTLGEMEALVERCMADYDENGWRHPAYHDGSDISLVGKK